MKSSNVLFYLTETQIYSLQNDFKTKKAANRHTGEAEFNVLIEEMTEMIKQLSEFSWMSEQKC